MRIVLCHQCWSWVPLETEQCPDCHQPVDLSEPDPSPTELSATFERVVAWLGRVYCPRRRLPASGALWGLARGLLFLPELQLCPNGSWMELIDPALESEVWRRWWPFRGRRGSDSPSPTERAEALPTLAPQDAAELFLGRPGAVFVPQTQVMRIHWRGSTCQIHRTLGPPLRLTWLTSSLPVTDAWHEFLRQQPTWRPLCRPHGR